MANIIYDSVSGDTILAQDSCVPMGELWENTGLEGTSISGPLALVDASSCPRSLGWTKTKFNNYFKDKVAIFAGTPQPEETCEDGFSSFQDWTVRLTNAGAAGVVHLSSNVNGLPGVWYSNFVTARALESKTLGPLVRAGVTLVPFVHCGITDTSLPGVSSAATLNSFLESMQEPLEERRAAIPDYTLVMNMTIETNTWVEMFNSPGYIFMFYALVPTMFLFCGILGVVYIKARARHAMDKARARSRFGKWEYFKAMVEDSNILSLVIETVSAFVLALYLYGDGLLANVNSPFWTWRTTLAAGLLIASTGSSILTALSFYDFQKYSYRMMSMERYSFIQKHKAKLVFFSIFLVFAEIILAFGRAMGRDVWQVGTLIGMGWYTIVTLVFVYTAFSFTSLLHRMSNTDNDIAKRTMINVIRRTRKWVTIATVAFLVELCVGAAINFTQVSFRSDTYTAIWSIMTIGRVVTIFAKVKLCRLHKIPTNSSLAAATESKLTSNLEGSTLRQQNMNKGSATSAASTNGGALSVSPIDFESEALDL